MNVRISVTLSFFLALVLAVACSSDDDRTGVVEPIAGSGGENSGSGGPPPVTPAGSGGAAASTTSGAGGKAGSPSSGGSGGAARGGNAPGSGGESEARGGEAPLGSAGQGNPSDGPVSACGAGSYDAGEPGCMACPALPSPAASKTITCDAFASAERDGDGNLILSLNALAIHEPFGGEVGVTWAEAGVPGSATVTWEYPLQLRRFVFRLPLEARYADEVALDGWAFTDACGFSFTAALRVYWDGVERQCGEDA